MALPSIVTDDVEVEPKSSHLSEAALQPFVQVNFDPADYLNSTLPGLAMKSTPRDQSDRVALGELSTRTQTLLSQLNAQTSRLSSTLTQLTDEILRSGSRLAYEVEILRGEATGLSDTLKETLKEDIGKFQLTSIDAPHSADPNTTKLGHSDPEFVTQLRTLSLVRTRLDSVIQVFGDAMQWTLAPSELTSNSLISISAPDVGPDESRSREEKSKATAQKLRTEVANLLDSAASAEEGILAATHRIEDLKALSAVWNGTAEEKARTRFIDQLSKLVEDEQRKLSKRDGRRQMGTTSPGLDNRYGGASNDSARATSDGYGFIKNLQRIKGDMYLD